MRKVIIFTLCSLLCYITVSAEVPNNRLSTDIVPDYTLAIGVRGGLSLSQWKMGWRQKKLLDDLELKSQIGWSTGFNIDVKLYRILFLETGLYYSVKNTRFEEGEVYEIQHGQKTNTYYPYAKMNPGYLELPVMLSAQFQFLPQLRFRFGTGAYIAYGISGKSKRHMGYSSIGADDEDVEIRNLFRKTKKPYYDDGNDNMGIEPEYPAIFRPFDVGLCFKTGLSFDRFQLDVCYDLGLRDILGGLVSFKTRSLSFRLGYDFFIK